MSLDDSTFETLHALALRKKSDGEGVASASGIDRTAVDTALTKAVEAKLAIPARGAFLVLPAGDAALRAEYPVRFVACRDDQRFVADYGRFEIVNRELKEVVTAWQTPPVCRPVLPNDPAQQA